MAKQVKSKGGDKPWALVIGVFSISFIVAFLAFVALNSNQIVAYGNVCIVNADNLDINGDFLIGNCSPASSLKESSDTSLNSSSEEGKSVKEDLLEQEVPSIEKEEEDHHAHEHFGFCESEVKMVSFEKAITEGRDWDAFMICPLWAVVSVDATNEILKEYKLQSRFNIWINYNYKTLFHCRTELSCLPVTWGQDFVQENPDKLSLARAEEVYYYLLTLSSVLLKYSSEFSLEGLEDDCRCDSEIKVGEIRLSPNCIQKALEIGSQLSDRTHHEILVSQVLPLGVMRLDISDSFESSSLNPDEIVSKFREDSAYGASQILIHSSEFFSHSEVFRRGEFRNEVNHLRRLGVKISGEGLIEGLKKLKMGEIASSAIDSYLLLMARFRYGLEYNAPLRGDLTDPYVRKVIAFYFLHDIRK